MKRSMRFWKMTSIRYSACAQRVVRVCLCAERCDRQRGDVWLCVCTPLTLLPFLLTCAVQMPEPEMRAASDVRRRLVFLLQTRRVARLHCHHREGRTRQTAVTRSLYPLPNVPHPLPALQHQFLRAVQTHTLSQGLHLRFVADVQHQQTVPLLPCQARSQKYGAGRLGAVWYCGVFVYR
jgi:hypothetical protein